MYRYKRQIYKALKYLGIFILIWLFFHLIGKVHIVSSGINNSGEVSASDTESGESSEEKKEEEWENALHSQPEDETDTEITGGYSFEENQKMMIGEYVSFQIPAGFELLSDTPNQFVYKEDGSEKYYIYAYDVDLSDVEPDVIADTYDAKICDKFGKSEKMTLDVGENTWNVYDFTANDYLENYHATAYTTLLEEQYVAFVLVSKNDMEVPIQRFADEILETVSTIW